MAFFGGEDPFENGGPGDLFARLAQGFGAGMMAGPLGRRSRNYDEYMKAYSVAMLPGKERTNVSYGGKIIMPPSALANLSALDIESPWMFRLTNPQNPAASTHAGVLEFIAEEGCVHLPYWMMKSLRLNEGDPIRITRTELPKGRFIKLQPQSVHFLEVSDPKAVLEHALRNFSALTQGDIIEISYNSIVFDLLIMETQPGNGGISIVDTDVEVDFAAPVGYKEPERPKAAPPSTMASKLKIDLNESTPGSSRPSSALSGAFAGTSTGGDVALKKGGEKWESFKGKGETLNGRKTKGRGISQRGIENTMEGSKVYRTDKKRLVTNDTLEADISAPAPLNIPFGKLFFGYKVVPYSKPTSSSTESPGPSSSQSRAFGGSGNSLTGRPTNGASLSSSAKGKGKGKGKEKEKEPTESSKERERDRDREIEAKWGKGQRLDAPTLASRRATTDGPVGAGGARAPRAPDRSTGTAKKQRERSPTPDWGVDDDDDDDDDDDEVIYVDSD